MNTLDNILYLSTLFKRISILSVPDWDQFFLLYPLRKPGILWSLFKRMSLSRILPQRFYLQYVISKRKESWNDFLISLLNLFPIYFISGIVTDSSLHDILLWSPVITHKLVKLSLDWKRVVVTQLNWNENFGEKNRLVERITHFEMKFLFLQLPWVM